MLAVLVAASLLLSTTAAILQESLHDREAVVFGSGDFDIWGFFNAFSRDDQPNRGIRMRRHSHGLPEVVEHKCNASVPGFAESLRELKARFKPEWRMQLQDAVKLTKAMPILMIANKEETCLLDNFLAHADLVPRGLDVLVAGLDQAAVDACQNATSASHYEKVKLQCFDYSQWLSTFADNHSDWTPDDMLSKNFGSCMYKATVWTKVVLLEAAAAVSSGVLFMDADIVLHGDLPSWVEANRKNDTLLMFGDEGIGQHGDAWGHSRSTPIVA
eukprot:TRINITY_DN17542_c0_g1_i2.p1 TRINITY_DN17542_c0_g1~~TRINITY_DN17542_c0_g1_i2.p1  ORF type:complete len:291 (-),score=52.50 TRINITY_DN17542_c0_g1_i2:44-859(-)